MTEKHTIEVSGTNLTVMDLANFVKKLVDMGVDPKTRVHVTHTDSQRDGAWTTMKVNL